MTTEEAAQLLETRQDFKGLPSNIPLERMTEEVWSFLEDRFPGVWPDWFKAVTIRYRLGGSSFFHCVYPEFPGETGACNFRRPSEFLVDAYQYFEPIETLAELGFVPFADGEDANVWVFRKSDGENPPVFFTELYGWSPDNPPTELDGLLPARKTFAEFLEYGATWKD